MATCQVCFRHCEIAEGQKGFCGVRTCEEGVVRPVNYGKVTSLALDPIEKKPLARFRPGTQILSVGSYGCNLRCPFCQNHEISWSERAMQFEREAEEVTPEELADMAEYYQSRGNIGVAFTYNEPLVGYEFVRDTARLVHERGMANVLVTNGTASLPVLRELAPYIDAMNIDLKGFTPAYYRNVLGGDLDMVQAFIREAVQHCHVELTTLIVPGENDSDEEILALSEWIASLTDIYAGESENRSSGRSSDHSAGRSDDFPAGKTGRQIPLHISRFFPRFHMTDRNATDVGQVYHLAALARRNLDFVYTGNC